jgi:hypothetical protein
MTDFAALLRCLHQANVDFIIVGGVAASAADLYGEEAEASVRQAFAAIGFPINTFKKQ